VPDISQNSVATCLACDGLIFIDALFQNYC